MDILQDLQNFQEKAAIYQVQHPDKRILMAFLSLGDFTQEALEHCQAVGIAWATDLGYD